MASHNNITLRQLRAFVTVADKGSFVKASHALLLSQPALSHCIKQLEEQIGSALFQRTTRNVYLTPLGMSFLPNARHLLRQFDATMDDLHETVMRKQGRVTIACLPSVASRLMPRVVSTNDQLFPGVRVIIRDGNLQDVKDMLLTGEADLGIGSGTGSAQEINSAVLAHDKLHAVLPVTSPLARKRKITWRELAEYPFVAMSHQTGVRDLLDEVISNHGIALRIVAEVSNIATLTGMIEEGIGLSALPGLVLPKSYHSLVRHRELVAPVMERTITLLWRREVGLSPAAQGLVMSIRQCLAQGMGLVDFPHVTWENLSLGGPSEESMGSGPNL